jgi:hypothetical protein
LPKKKYTDGVIAHPAHCGCPECDILMLLAKEYNQAIDDCLTALKSMSEPSLMEII